jgi:hypothetical protein
MTTDAKDAHTIIEKWRAELPHLVQPEAWMQPMIELLDAYDAMKQRAEASEASCAVAWASMETMQGVIDTLTRERDEARVVTDAMVERVARVILSRHVSYTGKNAEKAWLWYGDDFKNEAREYLTAAFSEAP